MYKTLDPHFPLIDFQAVQDLGFDIQRVLENAQATRGQMGRRNQLTEEERIDNQALAHLDAAAQQRDLPIQYDLMPRAAQLAQEKGREEARPLIDLEAINQHLTNVVRQYKTSAPTVSQWANQLYMTLQEDTGKVTVREIFAASALREEGQWEQANMAANRIYKLQEVMKQDTTGQAGF